MTNPDKTGGDMRLTRKQSCSYCKDGDWNSAEPEAGIIGDWVECGNPDVEEDLFDSGDEEVWAKTCGHFKHRQGYCVVCKKPMADPYYMPSIWGAVPVCGIPCALVQEQREAVEIDALRQEEI